MRICIAYIAVSLGPITSNYVSRFVATFKEYPPGVDAVDLLVICNGGPLSTELSLIFGSLNPIFYPRPNDGGWDISAYQDAAAGPCKDYDAMLCLGESNYFYRAGWLKRLEEAWTRYGKGMYSPYSSNAVRSHMNTTAFFTAPEFIRNYPARVTDRANRYEFEHGQNALWRRIHAQGHPCRLVTWDGEWEPRLWRLPPNILWRGTQENLLMWCNHSDGFANANTRTKAQWASISDAPFR